MRKPRPPFTYRRSIRWRDYDYRWEGVYFVTICTYRQANLFGTIVNEELVLNDLGTIAHEEWLKISELRINVLLDRSVVMPNHVHGLIIITERTARGESKTLKAGSLGAIVGAYKAAVSRNAKSRQLDEGYPIWQRNYHDHVVRTQQSWDEIRCYIHENPARWEMDSLYVR